MALMYTFSSLHELVNATALADAVQMNWFRVTNHRNVSQRLSTVGGKIRPSVFLLYDLKSFLQSKRGAAGGWFVRAV